jgi:predicted Ser/Thr protein kinase
MPREARERVRQAAARAADGFPPIEGYRFLRKLGEGGMGAVYLAEELTLGRRVAIKVVSAKLAQDAAARARFLREARAMATAEHPHLVRIYSFGESAGVVYIVMEYVEGDDLGERLRRLGRLPIEEALLITRQIAEALEAAAEKGIIHRDIKPGNVLIDARDHVRVADFGLAKPIATSEDEIPLTQTGLIVGTPHYLSPEQARGEKVDFRSDIYSLGILLYEMLAGAPPFRGATPVAVVAQHLNSPPPPLHESRTETPSGVVRLVEQMLEKDPGRRPQSYAALRKAIEESTAPPARWTSGSPYRGLAAFDFEHAAIFFGRTRAVEDVLNALRAQAASGRAFVLVLGMSGSGKSSLLRAGVLPRLIRPGTVEGVRLWRRAILRPADASGDLFDGLASALMRPEALPELGADGTTARELGRLLRESPRTAAPLIKGGLSQAAAEVRRADGLGEQPDVRLVLVIDQMEELFTLERIAAEERSGFIDALSGLARSGRVWVLATLRSDFYARCEELRELMALKEGGGQYHLLPPAPAEVAQMIRQPARAAGLRFEQDAATQVGLDEVLRDAAAGQVGNLPLLEFALEELYRQRTAEDVLTFAAHRSIGGVEGALTQRAETVFASLSPGVQATLPDVFAALVRVGSGEEETFNRRYASLDAFVSPGIRALVDAFIDSRLFVADRGDDGRAVVSIAHEAMLHSWPRLRQWLQENRELLRVRGRVAMAAALWVEKGRRGDLLLAEGKALGEALPLLGMRGIDLSAEERDFIVASEGRARQRRRARRLLNLNNVILLIGAAALMSLYLWKVVPLFASIAAGLNWELPLATRLAISASNWVVRLAPLLLLVAAILYRFRGRIRVPELVYSGMALAIVTAVGLFGIMLGLVALLFQAAEWVPWFRSGTMTALTTRAAYGLGLGDYAGAVQRLRLHHEWLGGSSEHLAYSAFLLGEAHLGLGDDDRARDFYQEALVRARSVTSSSNAPEVALLQDLAPKRLLTLEAELPRLGIRGLDAHGGALVAALNRGTPAFRAGLRKGDVIQRIDGVPVPDRSALVAELRRRSVGQEVRLDVSRAGRSLGFGVRLEKAADLFAAGCQQAYLEDCASLGTVYERGEGVPVDLPRAADLYRRACDGGEHSGCVSLALIYERGRGVAVDATRAAALDRKSCEAGDVWGCNNLGALHAKGTGVAKDEPRAGEMFRKACVAGLPEACANERLWADRAFGGDPNAQFLGGTSRPYTR